MRPGTLLTTFLASILALLSLTAVQAADAASYTIVLASAPGTGNNWHLKKHPAMQGLTAYVTQARINGKKWERLNIGFFNSRNRAIQKLNSIKTLYPGAWLKKASSSEIALARKKPLIKSVRTSGSKQRTKARKGKPSSLTEQQLKKLMQQAKNEFKNKNYSKAVRLFSAITLSGESKYSQEALELQGLARQRNGQKAHAARIYEKYLKLYPDSKGATRVQQRLSGLLTATRSPRKSITLSTAKSINELTTYGSISQFYRNDKTEAADTGAVTTLSQLITFADYTAIKRIDSIEHRFQITGDNTYDFLDTQSKSEFRLTELYYDISTRTTGSSARLGRQSLRLGSLLNRFDGLSAGYQITPDIRVSLIGGRPVEVDDKFSVNTHKTFYGYLFESGTFLKYWNVNIYHFEQKVDDIDDNISTGAEIQYRDDKLSVFTAFDYNTLYDVFNSAFADLNLTLNSTQSIHINVFTRQAPPLSTSNALTGQSAPSIRILSQNLNIEQIYQLAKTRTADSQTVTVGGVQKLNKNLQVNLDVTLAHTSSTDATQGVAGIDDVPATPSTGTDLFISSQLIGNNLILKNDTGVLGFRYFDTKTSDTLSLIANSRIPITRKWRLYPRLQYDIRNVRNGGTQRKLRGLIKTDYRLRRNARLDAEIGYDATSNSGQSLGSNSLFYTIGYRYDY